MREHELPTWNEIVDNAIASLDKARGGLSETRDWLGSDWRPLGSPLPDGAGQARVEVGRLLAAAKALIDEAKGHLYEARG